MPSGAAAVAFIRDVLGPRLSTPPPGRHTQTILLGDWNFVHNPVIDRMRVDAANHHPTANDAACPAAFALAAPQMVDTFRSKCPQRRVASHASRFGGARLDRIYVHPDFLPYVTSVGVMNVPEYISDHRPVFMHVAAAEGLSRRGRDVLPRLRTWFWNDPVLRHSFLLWVSVRADQAPAAGQNAQLLQWWPLFKADMVEYVRELNQIHYRTIPTPSRTAIPS